MDCQMPEMDGFEATHAIREADVSTGRKRLIPIIAVTASVLADERAACLAAGMDDVLGKPFRRADLLKMLQKWLPSISPEPKPPFIPMQTVNNSTELCSTEIRHSYDAASSPRRHNCTQKKTAASAAVSLFYPIIESERTA
jgi:DNA-binding response OmpR family regulator